MDGVKRSRKSRMKKRPEDWEDLKQEIAKELGLWDKVKAEGWSGLSAEESGRLGGIFSARKRKAQEKEAEREFIEEQQPYGQFDIPNIVYAAAEQASLRRAERGICDENFDMPEQAYAPGSPDGLE